MNTLRVQSHLKEIQDYINYKCQRSDASLLMLESSSIIIIIGKEQINEIITYVKLNLVSRHMVFGIVEGIQKSTNYAERRIQNLICSLAQNFIDIPDTILITLFDSLASLDEEDLKEFILNPFFKDLAQNYKLLNNFNEINMINDLVVKLLDIKNEKGILHADCGMGSFLLKAAQEYKDTCFYGYSSNSRLADLAQARAYIFDLNIQIDKKELFTVSDQLLDNIYITYPFNIKYDMDEMIPKFYSSFVANNLQIKKYSANMLACVFFLEQLSHDGKMIVLVPEGGLFNSIDKNIREWLINYNYLDAVISLPVGILSPYTGVKSSLIILKKNRISTDRIKLINAEDICHKKRREVVFTPDDINKIVDLYLNPRYLISREQIVLDGYYLSIQRYINSNANLINATDLGELCVKIFRGYQINAQALDVLVTDKEKDTHYRIVNISDLTPEGFIVDNLTPINIIDDTEKIQKYCLEDGDLVLTAKNTTIKYAIYEQRDDIKAVLTGNLIAIRVNKDILNPFYLKIFLDSESGKKELANIQTGTSIKTITPKNLERMQISLLSMEDQEKLATIYKEKINKIKQLIDDYNMIMNDLKYLYEFGISEK